MRGVVSGADRRTVMRPVKSWGRILDRYGRAADVVPVDLWADPYAGSEL